MVSAWLAFETRAGRGYAHLRLKDGRAWTLVTALHELKGHEEPLRDGRPLGVEHGADPARETWLEARRARGVRARPRDPARGPDRRRGPGRDRARRPSAPARRAGDHRRAQRPARRLVAAALQVALPARPGLVRPPAVPPVPRPLAGVLAEGQARRLAGDVRAGDGAHVLGVHRGAQRALRRGGRGVDRRGGARRRRAHAPPPPARDRHGHLGAPARAGLPGDGRLPGRAAPLLGAPGAGRVRRAPRRRDRLEQLRARHLRGAVGARRRGHDGPAELHLRHPLGDAGGARPRPAVLAGRPSTRGSRPSVPTRSSRRCPTGSCPSSRSRSTSASASATPRSTGGSRRPASSSTSARRARGCT